MVELILIVNYVSLHLFKKTQMLIWNNGLIKILVNNYLINYFQGRLAGENVKARIQMKIYKWPELKMCIEENETSSIKGHRCNFH